MIPHIDHQRQEGLPSGVYGTGTMIARNVVVNFIGYVVPLALAVLTVPILVNRLGIERFGVLSLAWVTLGTAGLFDLGLGRATTKLVAEALGRGHRREVPRLVWTAVIVQAAVGCAVAVIMAAVTPILVERLLSVPGTVIGETKRVFYILAVGVPIGMVFGSWLGVLEAAQRFDLVNALKIPASAATFLIPLVGAIAGLGLSGILATLIVARAAVLAVAFWLGSWVFPELRVPVAFSAAAWSRLWAFGGWVAASNALAPLLRYLDRYIIASLISLSAVAFYSVPFDLVERMWVIPASVAGPLFPAFSALSVSRDDDRVRSLFLSSVKYIALVTAPVVLTVGVFADPLLQVWLGAAFAEQGALPLRILGVAALAGVLSPIPASVIEGHGRPDLIAKLYLIYLPLNAIMTWGFVTALGIPGAAIAFAVRTLFDCVLVFLLAARVARISPGRMIHTVVRPAVILAFVAGAVLVGGGVSASLSSRALMAGGVVAILIPVTWCWMLDEGERGVARALLTKALS